MTLAGSSDGIFFDQSAPSHGHIIAKSPFPLIPDKLNHGFYGPTNILKHPKNEYYYFLARTLAFENQKFAFCLFRGKNPNLATDWKVWDGKDFSGTPSQGVHCPSVLSNEANGGGDATGGVYWSTFYEKFVLLTMSIVDWKVGFYIRLSDDLINWAPAKRIAMATLPWGANGSTKRGWTQIYPSFIDPRVPPNFDVLGKNAYLYFVSMKSERPKREIRRVSIEFTKDQQGDNPLYRGEGCYKNWKTGYYSNGAKYCVFLGDEMKSFCGADMDWDSLIEHQDHGTATKEMGYGGRCLGANPSPKKLMALATTEDLLPVGCYIKDGGGHFSNGSRSCPFLDVQMQSICGTSNVADLVPRNNHGKNIVDPPCTGGFPTGPQPMAALNQKPSCYITGGVIFFQNGQGAACAIRSEHLEKVCQQKEWRRIPASGHGTNQIQGTCNP